MDGTYCYKFFNVCLMSLGNCIKAHPINQGD